MKIEKAQKIKEAVDSINKLRWDEKIAPYCIKYERDKDVNIPSDIVNMSMEAARSVLINYYAGKIKEAEALLSSL